MPRLEGRVALVTGAGKGLGRSFCVKLAEEGAHIAAVTRADMEGLEQTAKLVRQKSREAFVSQVDVSEEAQVNRMAQEVFDRFGRVDVLVNNAAFYYGVKRKAFTEITTEEWDRMM